MSILELVNLVIFWVNSINKEKEEEIVVELDGVLNAVNVKVEPNLNLYGSYYLEFNVLDNAGNFIGGTSGTISVEGIKKEFYFDKVAPAIDFTNTYIYNVSENLYYINKSGQK